MEKIEEKIRQRFLNKSDCWADEDSGLPIPAMTFEAVLEIVTHFMDTRNDEVVKMIEAQIKELKERYFYSDTDVPVAELTTLLQTIKQATE